MIVSDTMDVGGALLGDVANVRINNETNGGSRAEHHLHAGSDGLRGRYRRVGRRTPGSTENLDTNLNRSVIRGRAAEETT